MSVSEMNRRELKFGDMDEIVAEVEQLAAGEVTTSGQHTFTEIVEHLALTHDMTTGKLQGPKPPWFIKLLMPFMKGSILNDKPLKPGFKLPPKAEAFFWPKKEQSLDDAIQHLKESVENYKKNGPLEKHPMFGKITKEQNLQMNLRHAALHLGFVHSQSA